MKIIGYIHTDFPEKFGIPRQSGMIEELEAKIVFEPEYRNPDAVRGLDEFSHIWLLWGFSLNRKSDSWSPTVRPPRLGGNKRIGVFATRSPYRPNSIGLSCVKIERIEDGPVIYVSGADLADKTPIYDIKPYLPYTDSHPDAKNGFAGEFIDYKLNVAVPENINIPKEHLDAVIKVLERDPRPSYQNDSERVYGMKYKNFEIKFKVEGETLTLCDFLQYPTE